MAGLYIHIPFCKRRCIYCDFYSTTLHALRQPFVEALQRELRERAGYLGGEPVSTVYLGGGTPTCLSPKQLGDILRTVFSTYPVEPDAEITVEANPDDLKPDYIDGLSALPINRVSVGVQTFSDPLLRLLRRRHTAAQAIGAIQSLRQAGCENISIDLIFGLPGQSLSDWQRELDQALALDVEHISAYNLTYEPDTPITRMAEKRQIVPTGEDDCAEQMLATHHILTRAGYRHYEISNYCTPLHHSRHNASYWDNTPYIGVGPSAHSYRPGERQWNTADLGAYLRERTFTMEKLDADDCYNEYVMTRLRTYRGADLEYVKSAFGEARLRYCLDMAEPFITRGKLRHEPPFLKLTLDGMLIADTVISQLFMAR